MKSVQQILQGHKAKTFCQAKCGALLTQISHLMSVTDCFFVPNA